MVLVWVFNGCRVGWDVGVGIIVGAMWDVGRVVWFSV